MVIILMMICPTMLALSRKWKWLLIDVLVIAGIIEAYNGYLNVSPGFGLLLTSLVIIHIGIFAYTSTKTILSFIKRNKEKKEEFEKGM